MSTALRNLRLLIAYDGTNYAGWQRQKSDPTIQGVLEDAISRMTSEKALLHGAGRTDAGVHALGMTANFLTGAIIPCSGFQMGLNSMLPADIRVLAVAETAVDFHARRSARSKTYIYHLSTCPVQLPTERLYSAHIPEPLDISAMQTGASLLKGRHDFASFEASGSRDSDAPGGQGAVREIYHAEFIEEKSINRCRFEITGNGFLRHMVRNLVGTLLALGRGKRSVADFKGIMESRDRSAAGPTAPAHGLYLKEVHY